MKKIIIVDDEPKIRSLFRRCLREGGYQTLEAEDGRKALRLLKKDGNVDLVILDIGLPQVSGMDVFKTIRTYMPQVKIIVSSVYSKDEQEFYIWDADDYYYKSESISVLMDKVDKLLEKPLPREKAE